MYLKLALLQKNLARHSSFIPSIPTCLVGVIPKVNRLFTQNLAQHINTKMITENLIAGVPSANGTEYIQAVNPLTQEVLPESFAIATAEEVHAAAEAAGSAFKTYAHCSGKDKAHFLRTIAASIEALGDVLIQRATQETGLPEERIRGERGRTCGQLRAFADLVEEGSWVEAVIDEALPERQPLPRPDIRKMLVPTGSVAVFTASNFPLAFSTAGGDTASALAAGCPVVVKAHPAHPGTNALVAEAIAHAAAACGLPPGVFSSVQGGVETGRQLVMHPNIKAVGFTGSFQAGKALWVLGNSRPDPIPVYAEMGSNNPVFILPQKLKQDPDGLATLLAASVNLGAGQFCTNPGVIVLQDGESAAAFIQALEGAFYKLTAATMLNERIFQGYQACKTTHLQTPGVQTHTQEALHVEGWKGTPAFASVRAIDFLSNPHLQEEVFGPFTLVVRCGHAEEVLRVAHEIQGQLTATVFGTQQELEDAGPLVTLLEHKVGRVIFNGVPTGVEVCAAMHHGGPFPATSNALFTSVGTDAIRRFVRPVSYQNAPETLLPSALKPGNPLGIWRTVNSQKTKA